VASPVRYSSRTKNIAYPFPQTGALKPQPPANGTSGAASLTAVSAATAVTALSIEFVAKPQEAHHVEAAIPAAIADALKDVTGFAGCLVMISDQEARLVTVVTLWAGRDRANRCSQNARWVHALLKPHLDLCLRVQTMVAHLPLLPLLPAIRPETIATRESSMRLDILSEDKTICVA
jgi:hypothetical protein